MLRLLSRRVRLLLVLLAGIGYAVALCGSFEQALNADPENPFFSSVYGAPFLHHYLAGFALLGASLILLLLTPKKEVQKIDE